MAKGKGSGILGGNWFLYQDVSDSHRRRRERENFKGNILLEHKMPKGFKDQAGGTRTR